VHSRGAELRAASLKGLMLSSQPNRKDSGENRFPPSGRTLPSVEVKVKFRRSCKIDCSKEEIIVLKSKRAKRSGMK